MRSATALLACGLAFATAGRAEVFVESAQPPSLTRGRTTQVELRGNDLDGATGLWTSLPDGCARVVKVGPSESDRARFEVEVSPGAPLGLYGLRIATGNGLGNVLPFLVDDLPAECLAPTGESDPATPVALPVALCGTFRESGVDRCAIEVKAGERVTFEVVANRLGKDADPLVTIRDRRRRIVAEHDNDGGLGFDGRFAHTFQEAGAYVVEVRDARYEGGEHRAYVLRMGHFPEARAAWPSAVRPGSETRLMFPQLGTDHVFSVSGSLSLGGYFQEVRRPGDDASAWVPLTASRLRPVLERDSADTPVTPPALVHGILSRPGERDWYVIDLEKGHGLDVRSEARSLGSPADLELVLLDPTGREVQRNDDVGLDDAGFKYAAQVAGKYRLRVRDMGDGGGPEYVYRLQIQVAGPRFEVRTETAGLTVPQGNRQPIPLMIARDQYDGPISLALVDPPPGVTLSPEILPAGTTRAVAWVSVAPEVPTGLQTIQIEAQAGRGVLASLVRTQPMIDREVMNVDRIKTALREDQRRPPPSLTDRVALLVTPPAPFSFEITSPLITLARYQQATLPIETTFVPGGNGSITFQARGGQLGPEKELRVQLFARIPDASPGAPRVSGTLHARNLAALAEHHVEVDATLTHEGRRVTLTRTVELAVKTAFDLSVEPAQITLEPGGSAVLNLVAKRVPSFDGPVAVKPVPTAGLVLPDAIAIAADAESATFAIKAPADQKPGRYRVRLPATATVSGFEEEVRGPEVDVEIKASAQRHEDTKEATKKK